MQRQRLAQLGVVAALAAFVCALAHRKSRAPARPLSDASHRLLARGRARLLLKLLDVGGFFGVDIGGTLSKIVFFLPDRELAERMLRKLWPQRDKQAVWAAKLASVHQLAGFILSRDRYGATGVRDAHLSFHMPELGGTFHFIHFETRRMEGALRLASRHGLAAGMHTICATGGGAQKVRVRARTPRTRGDAQRRHPYL